MSLTRGLLVQLICSCWLALASARAAHACVAAQREWVLFTLSGNFDAAFAEAARAHLAAELEPRGVAVCTELPAASRAVALARVFVEGSEDGLAVLRIEDDVTQTTVERKIDFSRVPREGRALTFGLAADELLGVGWASVVAKRAPPATIGAKVAVPIAEPGFQLKVAFDASAYHQGPTLAGPALVFGATRGHWLPELRLGMRYGNAITAPHGEVAFSDIHVGVFTSWYVTPRQARWRLGPVAGAEILRVNVQGQANAGALAGQGQSWALVASGGLAAAFNLNRSVFLSARLCGGYALVPVRASDAGQRVGGVQSFVAQASLAAGVMF